MQRLLLIGLLLIVPSWVYAKDAPKNDPKPPSYNAVVLQGLNKVTGHISTLEAPIGESVHFGTLLLVAERCWKSAPEDLPENAALLKISEVKPEEEEKQIFLGWMFSSSPGLSGLQHPVYDITVLACEAKNDVGK